MSGIKLVDIYGIKALPSVMLMSRQPPLLIAINHHCMLLHRSGV